MTVYSLSYHRINIHILELKVDLLEKKLAQYKQKIINVSRMDDFRYLKQLPDY
jgi:hypothetical protein